MRREIIGRYRDSFFGLAWSLATPLAMLSIYTFVFGAVFKARWNPDAPEDEIAARFDDIVDFSGLRDFIDQPVKTYSSGMYVRLAFSVATAFEPDILVIDEALSVGDGAFARKSFDRIMELKAQGATILFCSHSTYHVDVYPACERGLHIYEVAPRCLSLEVAQSDALQGVVALPHRWEQSV